MACLRTVRKTVPATTEMLFDMFAAEAMKSARAKWPKDVLRFGALLRVHRYARSKGERPLVDVLGPMRDHVKDKEIVLVGVQALAKGTDEQMADRHAHLANDPDFGKVAKRIALLHPDPQLIPQLLRLLTGILLTASLPAELPPSPSHPQPSKPNLASHSTSCAIVLWTVLDITTEWSATSWEQVMDGVQVVAEMPNGKELLERYEVMECLEDAWDDLGESEDDGARRIVTEYMMDMQQVLALLNDPLDEAAGETMESLPQDDGGESDSDSEPDSPGSPRRPDSPDSPRRRPGRTLTTVGEASRPSTLASLPGLDDIL